MEDSEVKTSVSRYWLIVGDTLAKQGRHDEAVVAFEQAIDQDPNEYLIWTLMGNCLAVLGHHKEALNAFEQSIVLERDDATGWNGKGNCLFHLGHHREALTAHEQAIALDPTYASPWYGKGNCLAKLGHDEEALIAYEQAIALKPDDALSWSAIGTLFLNNPMLTEVSDAAASCFRRCLWLRRGLQRASGMSTITYHAIAMHALKHSRTPLAAWRWVSTLEVSLQELSNARDLLLESLPLVVTVLEALPSLEKEMAGPGLRRLAIVTAAFGDPFAAIPMWRQLTKETAEEVEAWWWLADQLMDVLELPERVSVLDEATRRAEGALYTLKPEREMFAAGLVFSECAQWDRAARCFEGCRGVLKRLALFHRWRAARELGDAEATRTLAAEILLEEDAAIRRGEFSYLVPGAAHRTPDNSPEAVAEAAGMVMLQRWTDSIVFEYLDDKATLAALSQNDDAASRMARKVQEGEPMVNRTDAWRSVRTSEEQVEAWRQSQRDDAIRTRAAQPEVARLLAALAIGPNNSAPEVVSALARHIQTNRLHGYVKEFSTLLELCLLYGQLTAESFVMLRAYTHYRSELETPLAELNRADNSLQTVTDLSGVVSIPATIFLSMLSIIHPVLQNTAGAALAALPIALRYMIDAHRRRLDLSKFPSFDEFCADLEKFAARVKST